MSHLFLPEQINFSEIYINISSMEKLLIAAILPLMFSLHFTTSVESLPIGSSIPKADVVMKDVTGKNITLKEARKENGLLVMFSCNTCPVVIVNQQRTIAISTFASEQKIGVILLNSNEDYRDGADSPEAMKKYADNQQYKWYYAIDKKTASSLTHSVRNVLPNVFCSIKTASLFIMARLTTIRRTKRAVNAST